MTNSNNNERFTTDGSETGSGAGITGGGDPSIPSSQGENQRQGEHAESDDRYAENPSQGGGQGQGIDQAETFGNDTMNDNGQPSQGAGTTGQQYQPDDQEDEDLDDELDEDI